MRLDAYLANSGLGTRSKVKEYLKQKRITVDGVMMKDFGLHVDPSKNIVALDGKPIEYKQYRYYIFNKPEGYITATEDKKDETVMDLLDIPNKSDYFPVGRLDKDTEGLLLITNDGVLSHKLLSPKKHVSKVYFAEIEGNLPTKVMEQFKNGITLDDGYTCMSAELEILKQVQNNSEIYLKIFEGKFHQVKRMFEAIGTKVTYLKRISMGNLKLPDDLNLGEYRELTDEEVQGI